MQDKKWDRPSGHWWKLPYSKMVIFIHLSSISWAPWLNQSLQTSSQWAKGGLKLCFVWSTSLLVTCQLLKWSFAFISKSQILPSHEQIRRSGRSRAICPCKNYGLKLHGGMYIEKGRIHFHFTMIPSFLITPHLLVAVYHQTRIIIWSFDLFVWLIHDHFTYSCSLYGLWINQIPRPWVSFLFGLISNKPPQGRAFSGHKSVFSWLDILSPKEWF